MIQELLKLKAISAARAIDRAEKRLVRKYNRKVAVERLIEMTKTSEGTPVTMEAVQELLKNGSGVTLQIDGRETTLTPAQERSTQPATIQSRAVASPDAEDGMEADTVVETIVETMDVPEVSDELLAEINDSFGEVTFTAAEVEEYITHRNAPKQQVRILAEDLPSMSTTMTLAKINIFRPQDPDTSIMSGVFVSAMPFSGCGDPSCDCGGDNDDEEGIVMQFVPDDVQDRSVMVTELESELIVELSL